MCTQHKPIQKKKISSATLYLIAVILGVISGYSDIAMLQKIGLVMSDIFIISPSNYDESLGVF